MMVKSDMALLFSKNKNTMLPRAAVVFMVSCLFSSGCADQADTRRKLTNREFVWTTQSRPYEVVALGGSNVTGLGDQARTVQAVFPEPDDQSKVASALEEVYSELKADIEAAQPDAKYRRITVSFYDTHGDLEYDPGAWLCTLTAAPGEGEPLPVDAAQLARWKWRDPASRPSRQERKIDWNYIQALELADRSVEFSVRTQFEGLNAAERRRVYEQTYVEEATAAREQLASENEMTLDELQQVLDRVLAWKYAGETVDNSPVGASAPESDQADLPTELQE